MKILQIDGIKGLVTAAFIGICLFAGFVLFPGMVAMHFWNRYLVNLSMFPQLSLFQGVLLWGIVAVSYCILSKSGLAVSFRSTPELSEEELEAIIKTAKISSKMRIMNKLMSKADKVEIHKNSKEDNETSYVSSPISLNKTDSVEKIENEKVSNIK